MKELEKIQNTISPVVKNAMAFSIHDTESLTEATILLSNLNKQADKITTERERITRPLLDALAVERGRWKPIETELKTATDLLRAKMTDYRTLEKAKEKEATTQALDALKTGTVDLSTAISTLPTTTDKIRTVAGSITFKTVQKYHIDNLAKVPRKYLIPNDTKIRESMKANEPIVGISYHTEEIPINRR